MPAQHTRCTAYIEQHYSGAFVRREYYGKREMKLNTVHDARSGKMESDLHKLFGEHEFFCCGSRVQHE